MLKLNISSKTLPFKVCCDFRITSCFCRFSEGLRLRPIYVMLNGVFTAGENDVNIFNERNRDVIGTSQKTVNDKVLENFLSYKLKKTASF
jgi:hypothetical protein